MNPVMRAAVARIFSYVPTAIATLATSRLVIHHYGVDAFNAFSLVLSLIFLIPLNNLGVGASITNAYASEGPDSDHSRRVTVTAARVLAVSSTCTAFAATGLGAFGLWPKLIGHASGPNLYAAIAMVIYASSFLPGLGQSMLLGVHRTHVTVIVQTFFTPIILLGTIGIIAAGWSGSALMLLPPASLVAVNVITAAFASRDTGVHWSFVFRRLPFRRAYPGASIRALTGPVLIFTLSNPIALQSDRIVLSHVSDAHAVAAYSLMMQIFGPVITLVGASAQPLWPIYAKARAEGKPGPKLARVLFVFCGAAFVIGLMLAAISNPVAKVISGHQIDLGHLLPVTGVLAAVTAGLSFPIAMSLMHPAGARIVGALALIALPTNLVLSVILAKAWGAAGPLLATVIVGVCIQAIPGLLFSRALRRPGGRHHVLAENAYVPILAATALAGRLPGDAYAGPLELDVWRPVPFRPWLEGSAETGTMSAAATGNSATKPNPRA